eukprot:TRINITY_DN2868_c0_g2_i1.p1 TRINITY_DN2868_c0_g2~~TRINITY_DN2868_c0_g2_i1.p1  ORF type:complete len:652 (+),score=185.81 TRINITY_DN2868_c0_g2_i1:29-1957(+)
MSGSSYVSHPLGLISVLLFLMGIVMAIFEEELKIRKSKPLLVVTGLIWILAGIAMRDETVLVDGETTSLVAHAAHEYLLEFTDIFLFVLAAMSFVATMEDRGVFEALKAYLVNKRFHKRNLFWVTGLLAFIIGPIADNLTTALVMGTVVCSVGGVVIDEDLSVISDLEEELESDDEDNLILAEMFRQEFIRQADGNVEPEIYQLDEYGRPSVDIRKIYEERGVVNTTEMDVIVSIPEIGISSEHEDDLGSLEISSDKDMLAIDVDVMIDESSSPECLTPRKFDAKKLVAAIDSREELFDEPSNKGKYKAFDNKVIRDQTFEKIKKERQDDDIFVLISCANIVVAANAGGAFSPFGDITTLMVWQAGKLEFLQFLRLIIPCLVNWLLPAFLMSLKIPKTIPQHTVAVNPAAHLMPGAIPTAVLFLSTIAMVVCGFNFFHIPTAVTMFFGFGLLSILSWYIRKYEKLINKRTTISKARLAAHGYRVAEGNTFEPFDMFRNVLGAKTEWDTLLFFYAIIMSIGGLATFGYLQKLASILYSSLEPWVANVIVGVVSAVLDNIPCMFSVLEMNPSMDVGNWLLVTLTTGCGGSMLAMGSAAGVALMGAARGIFTFKAHLKYSWMILIGYAASVAVHMLCTTYLFGSN